MAVVQQWQPCVDTRLEYLSSEIFNFTTDDGDMDALFARRAVEVCKAISGRSTFEYIKDPEQYRWFLVMLNMPFFAKRTEYGTSVRGSWWESHDGVEFSSCGLFEGENQLYQTITFTADEWLAFIQAIIDFAEPEMAEPVAVAA